MGVNGKRMWVTDLYLHDSAEGSQAAPLRNESDSAVTTRSWYFALTSYNGGKDKDYFGN